MAIDRRAIYDRDGGFCGICGLVVPFDEMQLDHVTPRMLGGADDANNLRATHAMCNVRRGTEQRAQYRAASSAPPQIRLKAWRQRRVLTQRDLAAASGVGEATIARIETGAEARPSTVRRLAQALGIRPEQLLTEPPPLKRTA
jgi:DNA-binding XRE family transcriptional regulator